MTDREVETAILASNSVGCALVQQLRPSADARMQDVRPQDAICVRASIPPSFARFKVFGVCVFLNSFRVLILLELFFSMSVSTSGFALRINGTCPSNDVDCGVTIEPYHVCCPGNSFCPSQYNVNVSLNSIRTPGHG